MTYVIANWDKLFETAETRKLEHLKWSPAPNKLDGLGYRMMAQERDRCELFAAWNILRAIASKTTPKEKRGRLERDGRPLSAAQLAAMSGFPAPVFERALTFFSSSDIGWLLIEEDRTASATAADPVDSGRHPARPPSVPASPADARAEGKGRESREWNYPAGAGDEFRDLFGRWVEFRKGLGKKPKDWHAMFQEQLDWIGRQPRAHWQEIISQSMRNGWQGLFEPKQQPKRGVPPPAPPKQAKPQPPGWVEWLAERYPDAKTKDYWSANIPDSVRNEFKEAA